MEGATAKAAPGSASGGDGKSAGARAQDAKIAQYLEELKPTVLDAFEKDNVGSLPRPELAVRIGQIVTAGTEQEAFNLLDRRNLVGGLIHWLLHCSPKAPANPEPFATRAATPGPSSEGAGHARPGSNGKDDAKGSDRSAESYSKTVEDAKQTIQPLVMDRLDVSAASQLPRDELSHQLRDIVKEVLDEEKLRLNSPEQVSLVDLVLRK